MVSVIIPVFNVEKYLRQCLDSVISQTYTDLEIIIVDDGSTDSSGSICDEYAAADSRIQVIHRENGGLSAARNTALDVARGEWLVFVDSDDYLMPDMIERLYSACIAHDADMAACTHLRRYGDRIETPARRSAPAADIEIYNGAEKMDAYIRGRRLSNAMWAKLFSAELFSCVRFPVGRFYEDTFIMPGLVHSARRIVNMNSDGYVYRKRSGSITMTDFDIRHEDIVYSRLAMVDFIGEKYPELEPYARAVLIASCRDLLFRLAASGRRERDVERRLQRIYRGNTLAYVKHGRSKAAAAYAVLAWVSVPAALLAARFIMRFIKS